MKRPRIFMGLTEVAGYYRNLKQGFNEIEIPCCFINLTGHRFGYGGQDTNFLTKWIETNASNDYYKHPLFKNLTVLLTANQKRQLLALWESLPVFLLFVWCLINFDVFILGANASFFNYTKLSFLKNKYYDYKLLKLFRKMIICPFHGTDSRPPYLDGGVILKLLGEPLEVAQQLHKRSSQKKQILTRMGRYADYLIDLHTEGHFHERPFVKWQCIGLPCISLHQTYREETKHPKNKGTCIVHSPSNPEAKGTFHIRRAIQSLIEQGYLIDFIEIIDQPNQKVLEALSECDFVVDQLYAANILAGLGTEAAYFAKPTILCGYETPNWDGILPLEYRPPTLYARPENLAISITTLINDSNYRHALGQQAKRFVETQWAAATVAKQYLRLIHHDFPSSWYCDPSAIEYLQGWGLPEETLYSHIAAMIKQYGIESLQLQDKPQLKQRFMNTVLTSNP